MPIRVILSITALLVLFAGCTKDPITEPAGSDPEGGVAKKIINSPTDAVPGQLIVYFDDRAVETLEKSAAAAAVTRSAATRSGIAGVDHVLSGLDASSLRRVFPCNPKSEERTRAAGLHKWYVVNFNADADLRQAAGALAAAAEVNRIQFSTRMRKASDCRTTPLSSSTDPATRAEVQTGIFNDTRLYKQWHYMNNGDKRFGATARAGADINVQEAWKLTAGNPSIIVAIVDEGVKYSHPDLEANMWVNSAEKTGVKGRDDDGNGYDDDTYGFNFVTRGAISWDKPFYQQGENIGDSGHGTHVAGTVSAVNNNRLGVCGVAGGTGSNDGVKLMSCQIFSGGNPISGSTAVTAEAIKYAADNGASIIQCSFGYGAGEYMSDDAYNAGCSLEREAIDYFIATKNCDAVDGGIVIFASGNEAAPISGYPAAYRNYISVTAFSPDYLPAYYTNYGPGCNIAAPGGDYFISPDYTSSQILSTLPSELNENEDYGYMQGTSMACPHVSGVAALGLSYALSKGKHFTLEEFKSMLLSSVNDIDTYLDGTKTGAEGAMQLRNYRKRMGTGSIDAYQLLMQIEGTPCLKAKVGTKQLISLNQFFGGASANLTYLGVEMSQAEMERLGIAGAPTISSGMLEIKCSKPGVAKITVKAIAGGENIGTGDEMGGMAVTKEFAIIARAVQAANGGWL